MGTTSTASFADVKSVVVETLGISDRADTLDPSTPLLDGLPELDSMAVVELIAAIEERFDIRFDDDEVNAELFETLGGLAEFVAAKAR
ncbi:acyl carrier protein [Micromonospora sp. RTP1Z1]|uniref:acyl carrier protein n=1 Tax=Micromonospora sp. RTP1Z1 TaxID=2994043 RepID=UPI0029C7F882|nr:acyl carrier protein [Micromonospora sp. RTP1Z1]